MDSAKEMEGYGWVYICMDIYKPNKCKVGCTTRRLSKRVTETGNPDYAIVKAYRIIKEEVRAVEKYVHKILGSPQHHFMKETKSEWFNYSPEQACQIIEYKLGKTLGMQSLEDGSVNLSAISTIPFKEDIKYDAFAFCFEDEMSYKNLVNAVIGCRSETHC